MRNSSSYRARRRPEVPADRERSVPRTVRRAANRRAAVLAREAYAAYRDAMLADVHEGLEESQIAAWRPGSTEQEGGTQ
jgi:hypothetical protein